MASWTLEYGGVEKSLAAWGLSSDVELSRRNMGVDELSIIAPGAMDASAFTYGAAVIVRRDRTGSGTSWSAGSIYFRGKVAQPRRMGAPDSEAISYRFAGPWWDFERLVFQQEWTTYNGDPDALVSHYASDLFLGQTAAGSALDTGGQIEEAVNWAIARGVSVQLGTVDAAANIPVQNVRDTTVAEVIRSMLRWTPDVICWFDYATSPPTFHARSLVNLTAVTITPPADKVRTIDLVPKHELVLPAVLLRFKQTHVVDGKSWIEITDQKYPGGATGLEIGASVHTVELTGIEGTNVRGDLVTAAIDAQSGTGATRVAWWKKKFPWLSNAKIANLTIASAVVRDSGGGDVSLATYPNELVDGTLADWMALADETPVIGQSVTVKALAEFDLFFDDDHLIDRQAGQSKELSVHLKATNAVTGTYATLESFDPAEAVPTGLAQAIYDAHSTLQYEGSLSLVGAEVPTGLGMGCKVNLVLAGATYSNLLVQSVTESVGLGRVTLTLGPASHLGVADLIELLRVNRSRMRVLNPRARSSGQSGDQGSVTLGNGSLRENSSDGVEQSEATFVSAAEDTGKRCVIAKDAANRKIEMKVVDESTGSLTTGRARLLMDISDFTGKEVRIRELKCAIKDLAGATKQRVLVLASDAYDTALHEDEMELLAGSGSAVKACKIETGGLHEADDYLTVKEWDGSAVTGSAFKIALPRKLRIAARPNTAHVITPAYAEGDLVYAFEPTGGTGVSVSGTAVTWQELMDARGWGYEINFCEVISGTRTARKAHFFTGVVSNV